MTSRKYFFLLAMLLPVLTTAQTIHYDSGYSWRGYTGTVAPTCPSKLCHYFQMTSADPYFTEYAAWKSTTDNPNTASAFVNFRVVFPRGYNKHDASKKWPVIILFHGAGESGRVWSKHYNYVPTDSTYDNNSHQLKHGGHQHRLAAGKVPSNDGAFPGIIVFPQTSYNGVWGDSTTTILSEQEKMLVGFVEDYLVTNYHADINRVVAHGLSNGAKSLWALAQKRPDLFAAILPMSGVPLNPNQAATILATTPIRLFQGGLDTNPTPGAAKQTINAFIAKGGTPEYFLYEDLGHGTWNRAYSELDFWLWIRARDKRNIHVFGGNTQLCNNPIKLGFSANMLSYQWTKDGVDIAGATGRYLENITQPGSYSVKFQRPNGQPDESFAVNIIQSTDCSAARPVLSANLNAAACSQMPASITLDDDGGATSAATFNITAINFNGLTPSAGSPAIGNGFYNVEIFDDAYINKGTAPVTVVYTVVPVSEDGFAGNPGNVVLTVNPEPVLKPSLSVTRCSDIASGITLDDNGASVNAATFDITAINFNDLIASAGTPAIGTSLPPAAISDDAYTNVTIAPKNVIYSVIPKSSAGCMGQSGDITLGVQPEPVLSSALDATVGSEQASGIILDDNGSGVNAASFNVTQINFNGLTPSAGSPLVGNGLAANVISNDAYTNSNQASVDVIYSIQPKSDGGCLGNVANVTLTVSPVPVVGGNLNATRCSDVASGITLSDNGSGVQAASYDITAINFNGLTASAGNPAMGTGLNANVISDDAFTNKTGAAKNVVYTVVPVSSAGHRGKSAAVTLTVNPEPVLKPVTVEKCSRNASAIILDDNGTGVNAATFNITAINFNGLTPSAGTPAIGTGLSTTAISDDAYVNSGLVSVQVSYTIVPVSSDACPGDAGTATFTVRPEPVLSSTINAVVESDTPSGLILDDNGSSVNATAFQITAINLNGLAASAGGPATGDNLSAVVISDDAFTNSGAQPVSVVYSVIPISQQSCRGSVGTVTLTVDPKPVVNEPGEDEDGDVSVTRCSDVASGIILSDYGSGVQAASFDITEINFNGLTASAGNPAIGTNLNSAVVSDDAFTNKTGAARYVVYTVVPVSSAGARGNAATVTITVNPEPVLNAVMVEKCSRAAAGITLDDNGMGVNAARFNITAINFNGLTAATGSPATGTGMLAGAISDDAYINNGPSAVQVVYTVVPVSSDGCPGDGGVATFNVRPEPVLSTAINASVQSDAPSGIILDDNGLSVNATAFQITSINLNGLTASAGVPATGDNLPAAVISDDAFTNATNQAVNVVYSVIPISQQNCRGSIGSVTLSIEPKPAGGETGEGDGGDGGSNDDDQDSTDIGGEVVTALQDFQNNEQGVFPNPTRGKVIIRPGTNDWQGPVMVLTSTGQVLMMQTTRGADGSIELDLSDLARGFYVLRSGSFVAKVIKE